MLAIILIRNITSIMTEQYWQKYINQIALDPAHRKDKFWSSIRQVQERYKEPKHHLELYSMCRSDNPYIRFIHHNSGKSRTVPI